MTTNGYTKTILPALRVTIDKAATISNGFYGWIEDAD